MYINFKYFSIIFCLYFRENAFPSSLIGTVLTPTTIQLNLCSKVSYWTTLPLTHPPRPFSAVCGSVQLDNGRLSGTIEGSRLTG